MAAEHPKVVERLTEIVYEARKNLGDSRRRIQGKEPVFVSAVVDGLAGSRPVSRRRIQFVHRYPLPHDPDALEGREVAFDAFFEDEEGDEGVEARVAPGSAILR